MIGTRSSLGPQVMKQWRQAMLQSVPVSWNHTVSSAKEGTSGACSAASAKPTSATGSRTVTRFSRYHVQVPELQTDPKQRSPAQQGVPAVPQRTHLGPSQTKGSLHHSPPPAPAQQA